MVCTFSFFAILLLCAAAPLGYYAYREYTRAALLGKAPSHAGKLKPGPCRKVKGKVVAIGKPLRSPLGNQPCVYYRLRIDEERTRWTGGSAGGAALLMFLFFGVLGGVFYTLHRMYGPGGDDDRAVHSWENVLDDADDIELVVRDDTGEVEVDLRDAEVIPKDRAHIHGDLSHAVPHQVSDLVRKRYRIFTADENGRIKTMRFVEETLKEGTKVTVVGPVWERPDGTLYFRKKGGPMLVSEKDVVKEGRQARNRTIGMAAGAVACLAIGLGMMLIAVVVTIASASQVQYAPPPRRF